MVNVSLVKHVALDDRMAGGTVFPSKFRKFHLSLVVKRVMSLCTPKMSLETAKGRRIMSFKKYRRLCLEMSITLWNEERKAGGFKRLKEGLRLSRPSQE